MRIHVLAGAAGRATSVDFTHIEGRGLDAFLTDLRSVATYSQESGRLASASIRTLLNTMSSSFTPWLLKLQSKTGVDYRFSSIDAELFESYVMHVREKYKPTTAANRASHVLIAMRVASEMNLCKSPHEYGIHRWIRAIGGTHEPTRPYSQAELAQIIEVLKKYLSLVREDSRSVPQHVALSVYYLMLALRTGFNATPLLGLSREALIEHPLRPGYGLLIAYKDRAKREVSSSSPWISSVDQTSVCDSHAAQLYEELLSYTSELASRYVDGKSLAFLRKPLRRTEGTDPIPLTRGDLNAAIHGWIGRRHTFIGDDGVAFWPTAKRLRATLAARAFDLADGDPLVVAQVLGNTPRTTANHYLNAPSESIVGFHDAMNSLRSRLDSCDESFVRTPVSGCSDPLGGRYAPRDGVNYCERWTQCFKCPNQVITGDPEDLWRLYSFYWTLQRKRALIRRLPSWALVKFSIRAMETVVLEKYGDTARRALSRARDEPHPFWVQADAEGWLHASL